MRIPKLSMLFFLRGWLVTLVLGTSGWWCVGPARADKADATKTQPAPKATYWAYQPVTRPAVPAVKQSALVKTPIDAFLLARLEKQELSFSAPATKRELLRRAKFDLWGLPPTPEELAHFEADNSPDAYEKLLDRLLASPHYGERWGRHWLDVVRYADSAGYNADPVRPLAYKYRDYVIQSFQADKPFDRFVQEQLAGDELFPDQKDALIATGFLRLPPDESNASNVLLARQDFLNDITANIGNVFLGQSIGCAQCHDHKFDAITQKDFYQIQAYFAAVVNQDSVPVANAQQWAEYAEKNRDWLDGTQAMRDELQELELIALRKATKVKRLKFPDVVLQAVDTPKELRTAYQQQLTFFAERQIDYKEPELLKALTEEQRTRRAQLKEELKLHEEQRPKPPATLSAMVAVEGREMPKTHLLAGGSYNKPLDEVPPGYLSAIGELSNSVTDTTNAARELRPGTSGRRADLARWLTLPDNPLTARVYVNRIWQGHFGRGIASNANDFGTQSPAPTHPELLDWLTAEFVAPTLDKSAAVPWGIKRMHKLIMLSTAYQQATDRSAQVTPAQGTTAKGDESSRDPGNQLYGHFPRRRLEAEAIRDSLLAVSGLLETKMHGPGVLPEIPPNFTGRGQWTVSSDVKDRHRRSVYILLKRNLPYPLLDVFDFPDMHESCACRPQTTIAPQALMLLNSDMVLRYAQAFAGRLLAENPDADTEKLVRAAYEIAFGRLPSAAELRLSQSFLTRQAATVADRSATDESRKLLLPSPSPKTLAKPQAAALVDFCHALFNANEFVYVD